MPRSISASDVRKFFKNFHVYWGIIVSAFLGGIYIVWMISERLSSNVSMILIDDPNGFTFSKPKIINVYLIFAALLAILILFIALIAAITEIRRASPEINELKQLRAQYDDLINFSKNIVQNFYDDRDDLKRTDPRAVEIYMTIEEDGSAWIKRTYTILCPEKPAHLFTIWIEADDESPGISGHRPLRFRARDLTKERDLDWIPSCDSLRRKEVTIFFPEMQREETKTIEIEYFWPGYLNKLFQRDVVEFWWSHSAASEDATAEVKYEWFFKSGFPSVRGKLRGNLSDSANLKVEHRNDGVAWIYHDPSEIMSRKNYRIVFELLTIEE